MNGLLIADYAELAKPLKKPPHGLEWRRLEDGAWELRSIGKALSLLEQREEARKREEEEEKEKEGDFDCLWLVGKEYQRENKRVLWCGRRMMNVFVPFFPLDESRPWD